MKFTKKTPQEILKTNKTAILNFQNLYSVYLFNKIPIFQKAIMSPNNIIFPDGRILSFFLNTRQVRGPSFTRDFFENKINEKQKHFFIGDKNIKWNKLQEKYPKLKNIKTYVPPYAKTTFKDQEIEKIVMQLKKSKPDYVWVCIGNPKQEILANQLFKEYLAFYFNVGAAIDFLVGRKKEIPLIFRRMGLEWFYRLVTDFKYSWRKVWRSLLGLWYLRNIEVEK